MKISKFLMLYVFALIHQQMVCVARMCPCWAVCGSDEANLDGKQMKLII